MRIQSLKKNLQIILNPSFKAFNNSVKDITLTKDTVLQVPYKLDLELVSSFDTKWILNDKFQGNCIINAPKSTVEMNKVRGDVIDIRAQSVIVHKYVEGTKVNIVANDQAKALKVMADQFTVLADRIQLGAIYATNANIDGNMQDVDINNMHGALKIYGSGKSCCCCSNG